MGWEEEGDGVKWKREGGEDLELQFSYFQGHHQGHSSTGDYMILPMICNGT